MFLFIFSFSFHIEPRIRFSMFSMKFLFSIKVGYSLKTELSDIYSSFLNKGVQDVLVDKKVKVLRERSVKYPRKNKGRTKVDEKAMK